VVRFLNAEGLLVFCMVSDYQPNNIPNVVVGTGEVVCRIASLPLAPGTYNITLRLWKPGEQLDEIDDAMRIQVEWKYPNAQNQKWNSRLGSVYVDAHWRIFKAADQAAMTK
jgi:hypothetical protein